MSIKLSGDKPRVVNHLQTRLDKFYNSSKAYEGALKELDVWAAKNVQLPDIPAHEVQYQTLLSKYKEAAYKLKCAADGVKEKTDPKHIHKYFRLRYTDCTRSHRYRYINWGFKDPLEKFHTSVTEISKTDFETQITQAQNASQRKIQEAHVAIEHSRREAEAAREYSLIDQTFPSCRDRLIEENPPEYLRQSALYQNKLLEKKDTAAALAFGKSWIKNLPKEAIWEQVDNMSVVMLEAAKTTDSSDMAEYRVAVEQWLKEHPLAENPESIPLTPAQAASPVGRRIYVLGLLYLNDQQGPDLSPEAFQVYQNCSSLYPDQNAWKVVQAYYHISKQQWSEAKQLLAPLPQDDTLVIQAQKNFAKTWLAWRIDQVYDRAFKEEQLSEAEQMLAELPPEEPSVSEAQKFVADHRHELNVRQNVAQALDRVFNQQWSAARLLLADLPQNHPLVIEAQKILADTLNAWNVARKLEQAYEHISKLQWLAAEQLLANLSQDDPLVIEAQKILADTLNAWNVSRKLEQAYNHISKLQWLAAEQLLADLSQDDPKVKKAQKELADALRERIWSAGLDLGAIAFSRLVPSSYRDRLSFDIVQTAMQLLSNTSARRIWLPFLLRTSDPSIPIPHLPFSSKLSMAGDSVDFVFRHIAPFRRFQKEEIFTSNTLRLANMTWVLYSNPQQRSYLSYMSIGSALISTSQAYDEWRGNHRAPAIQALLSTAQHLASDLGALYTIASYGDLVPFIGDRVQQIARGKPLIEMTVSASTEETSKEKWFLAAVGIGSVAVYRLCFDYPYLWAACVMKEAEFYSCQGKYGEANRVLKESENSWGVRSARPAVQSYAKYASWLKDYPKFLVDPAKCQEFLKSLDDALSLLKTTSYYSGVCNNLLLKKMEVAILQQDSELLKAILKERPADQIVAFGFNVLVNHVFYFALNDPTAACTLLQKMEPEFPPRFHPAIGSLLKLFQDESNEVLFQSDIELSDRLSHQLVLFSRMLRKAEKHKDALKLMSRVKFNSVKDNELIQNYNHFFSLLYTLPLKRVDALELPALEKCIAGLEKKDEELRVFFSACRIVLNLEAGDSAHAKALLAQEKTDSKIPAETAALLFERMFVSMQKKGAEKALSHLKIIETLGPWQHQELFTAFQAYLLNGTSPEDHLEYLTTTIEQLTAIEQLSTFAYSLQLQKHLLQFEFWLSQENFQEAKKLLTESMSQKLYPELRKILFLHFINSGEQLRLTGHLRTAREALEGLNNFFATLNSDMAQSYLNFLAHLENIEENKEIIVHQKAARQSLEAVFSQLEFIRCPIPYSLTTEMVKILSKTAFLAQEAGQLKTALEAWESIKALGVELIKALGVKVEDLDHFIQNLKGQLNTR